MKYRLLAVLPALFFSCAPSSQQAFAKAFIGPSELNYETPLAISKDGKRLAAKSQNCVEIFNLDSKKMNYRNCNLKNPFFNDDLSKIYSDGKIYDVISNTSIGSYESDVMVRDNIIVNYSQFSFNKISLTPIKMVSTSAGNVIYASYDRGMDEDTYILNTSNKPTTGVFQEGQFLDAYQDQYAVSTSDNKLLIFNISNQLTHSFTISDGDSMMTFSGAPRAFREKTFMHFINNSEIVFINKEDALVLFNINTEDAKFIDLTPEIVSQIDKSGYEDIVVSSEARTVFFPNSLTLKF